MEMLPTCRDMLATTRCVASILARWVRVADTKLKMLWQFVSARADVYQIFRSVYVEIYYGMGVHMHRYYCHVSCKLHSFGASLCNLLCWNIFYQVDDSHTYHPFGQSYHTPDGCTWCVRHERDTAHSHV